MLVVVVRVVVVVVGVEVEVELILVIRRGSIRGTGQTKGDKSHLILTLN
jgi:hypothetical protein